MIERTKIEPIVSDFVLMVWKYGNDLEEVKLHLPTNNEDAKGLTITGIFDELLTNSPPTASPPLTISRSTTTMASK